MESGPTSSDDRRAPGSPDPQAPRQGPQAPPPPPGQMPQAPAPEAPAGPPGYGGPVPPGGWQQPIAQHAGWQGAPLSGWWSRVGAQILDWLILSVPVIAIVVLVVVVAAGSDVGAVITGIIASLAYVVAAIFYAPLLMKRPGRRNGQTWGKQALGIRVVRDTGEDVDLGYGFLREVVVKYLLFNFVGGFFASIPTLLDYLWPLWDAENRALHDMVVKSHVVKS